ncbi:hypothetical protein TNCV_3700361 [Trichonephila clavipes]|nr:hypothetical protein TNCV_3700361 [Trichonephila clavipes]
MNKIQGYEQLLTVYTQLLYEGKLDENKEITFVFKKSIEETAKSNYCGEGQIIANERNNVLMANEKKEEKRESPIPVKTQLLPPEK